MLKFGADMWAWNTGEDFMKAYIKGGDAKIKAPLPANYVFKKMRSKTTGKAMSDIGDLAFKKIFAKGAGYGLKGIAARTAFNWMFNPYIGAAITVGEAIADHRKAEMKRDRTRHINNNDSSMGYKTNDRFNMINQSNQSNMENEVFGIQQVMAQGNLATSLLDRSLETRR